MPLQKLVFKPGINKEGTNYTNEGGWFDCDKVRFRSGNAEKIGGWTRLSNDTYQGIARALWNWGTLAGLTYWVLALTLNIILSKVVNTTT